MLYGILFILELLALFFLSKRVQKKIGLILLKITRNKKISVYLLALTFIPGTFVHEISHFLAALFLLVPVGNLELLPKIEEDNIKLGSVGIAKTDPVRRFLIGFAPFLLGTSVIILIIYFTLDYLSGGNGAYSLGEIFGLIFVIYLIFTITNTMFSSKKDMEGLWGFIACLILTFIILVIFGINFDINISLKSHNMSDFFSIASFFLLVPLLLDIMFLSFFRKIY